MKKAFTLLALGICGLIANGGIVNADIISSATIPESLSATDPSNVTDYYSSVLGSSLPFVQSLPVSTPRNGSISANYNFSQTATTANFGIRSTGTLTLLGQFVAQYGSIADAQSYYPNMLFTVGQNVTFSLSFTSTLTAGTEAYKELDLDDETSGAHFYSNKVPNASPISLSGMFTAGDTYQILEEWNVSNTEPGDATSGSGTESFSLTMTAVPEPSSLCLLGGIAGIATRRRRLRKD